MPPPPPEGEEGELRLYKPAFFGFFVCESVLSCEGIREVREAYESIISLTYNLYQYQYHD